MEKKQDRWFVTLGLLLSITIHAYFLFFFTSFSLNLTKETKKKITISLSAKGELLQEERKKNIKKQEIIPKEIPKIKKIDKQIKEKLKKEVDINKIIQQKKSIEQKEVKEKKTGGNLKGIEGGVSKEIINQYVTQIYKLIDSKKNYPRQSLIRKEEGVVLLQIIIRNDGELVSVKSLKSKHQRLVDSSFDAVEDAAPFPPFPSEIKRKKMIIEVPVIYKIR